MGHRAVDAPGDRKRRFGIGIDAMLLLAAGLILLVAGAEILVRGASRLAAAVGISPLVVGLTVVAFGTSAPELAVSIAAAWSGNPALALGNVVGSNIFNVLFILGLAALITPLVVAQQLVRLDVPFMIAVSLALVGVGLDGTVSRLDGLLLFAVFAGYTTFLVWQSRKESRAVQEEYAAEYGPAKPTPGSMAAHALLVVVGLGVLVAGSRLLVTGAVDIAQALGLSDLVIGLTIVAAGTSMPEVATSVIAAIRGERDIAAGNVIGSNIFNVLCVLGLASIVAPAGIEVPRAALLFDIPVMSAVAVACLPIFFTGHRIARWEGGLFLGYYVAYTAYVVLDASDHEFAPVLATAMVWFVLPLTALTLGVLLARSIRRPSVREP